MFGRGHDLIHRNIMFLGGQFIDQLAVEADPDTDAVVYGEQTVERASASAKPRSCTVEGAPRNERHGQRKFERLDFWVMMFAHNQSQSLL